MTADRIEGVLIERLRQLPETAREFALSADEAERLFGLDATTRARLLDAGLPARGLDGTLRFDVCDLHYAGLRLGTARAHLFTIRSWARSLTTLDAAPASRVHLRYLPLLPESRGEVAATVRRLDGRRMPATVRAREVVLDTTFEVPPGLTVPQSSLAPLVAGLDALELCLLPAAAQTAELALRTGLSDCGVAAGIVLERCRTLGLAGRQAHGLILAAPCSTTHTWAEVLIAGEWTAVDPILLNLLHDFGGLDRERWPLTRSPKALLRRLGDASVPLVESRALGPIETTLLTRISTPAAGDATRAAAP
jgi:hypothetical protein